MERDLLKRITRLPNICHGKPTIRGLRYPVENVLEWMASGMSNEEILKDYPDLEQDDLMACLVYASRISRTKTSTKIAL